MKTIINIELVKKINSKIIDNSKKINVDLYIDMSKPVLGYKKKTTENKWK